MPRPERAIVPAVDACCAVSYTHLDVYKRQEWLDANGAETSVVAFTRKARDPREAVVFVLNCSDQPYKGYRIGVPYPVAYRELLNSDASKYGGSGKTPPGQQTMAEEFSSHGFAFSIVLDLPPLSAVVLKPAPLKLE